MEQKDAQQLIRQEGLKYKKSNEVPEGDYIPRGFFGERLLDLIDRYKSTSLESKFLDKIAPSNRETKKGLINDEFEYLRQDLFSKYDSPRFAVWVHEFLSENSGRRKLLSAIFDPDSTPEFKPIPTKEEVMQISDEELEKLCRTHKADFEASLERFGARIDEFRFRFIKRAEQKIKSQRFPIAHKVLLRRVLETNVALVDSLETDTEDAGGFYNTRDGISLSEQEFFHLGEEIYTHEMFHALSGRTIVVTAKATDYEQKEHVIGQRIGLKFSKKNRFRWLNEAVTEMLKQELLEHEPNLHKHLTYKNEISLFKFLMENGHLDKKLFLDAYFENYDPNAPEDQRIPAWKRLSKAITDAYGSGFLVRLDKLVQRQGAKRALEMFQKDWKQI